MRDRVGLLPLLALSYHFLALTGEDGTERLTERDRLGVRSTRSARCRGCREPVVPILEAHRPLSARLPLRRGRRASF
jgi:hypothetical protein